MFVIIFLLIF